eukprot:scaffold52930_cov69-Phaeocystis_antarctica.AAC.2
MAQSYQAFRESLNLPSGDVDPTSLPLPKLPIPPFEVPASVAASAARAAAAEELEEMTLQQGASRDATQSPKTCRLRLDNFLDPADISDDDDHEWADVEADPTGDLLPGMVPAISEPPAPGAMRSVALHRPAAVRATALPEDEDPEGLLAAIGAEWDDEDEDEGEGSAAERTSEPATTGQAADDPPAELGTGVSLEGVEAFSLDPSFDYDNVKCSERFSVDIARREGEFYDRE